MKESLSQQQELRQQQRLTPMQVQFVKMLEMTGPEIEAEVKRSLDDMPALEAVEHPDEGAAHDEAFSESAEDVQIADYKGDDIPAYLLEARNYSPDDARYEPVAVNDEKTLMESLREQVAVLDIPKRKRMAADFIIGNLDGNGYLTRPLASIADDIAFSDGIDVSVGELEDAWQTVRTLDPAGVGATDLRDCLVLQIERRKETPDTALAMEILTRHFDLFSKKHYTQLARRLDITPERLREVIALISRLNPKPGNPEGDTAIESTARQIVPEFLVEADGNNLTVTLLNNIPELTISETFSEDAPLTGMTPRQKNDALTFIRSRREEALNFIKTLKMRQSTLFSVMSAIVAIQREFFLTGDETKLKPMILKDISTMTGYDMSVISRATASKYVMTMSGIYPLKFFFNERPKDDDDATYHQIAAAIRKIVDNEDKDSPLSDEAIVEALKEQGFNLARRTVTKYRERMSIPVARLRRTL